MTSTNITASEKLRELTLNQLLRAWESTEYLNTPETPAVRGWIMNEINRREPLRFDAWLNQEAPEDKDLRHFVECNSMCLNCTKWRNGCGGKTAQFYTGCVFKVK